VRSNQSDILELESRRKIYEVVKQNAGCHMREILRASGMSFGMVSYHLAFLGKNNLIKEEKDGSYVRYYPVSVEAKDEKLLALLRQRSVRAILIFVIGHEGCSHQEISAGVHLAPSTTTWHLKKLIDTGIVISDKKIREKAYSLGVPQECIVNLLITYRESFLDNLVDGFLELWD
jgi:predicted transcriptional regulator